METQIEVVRTVLAQAPTKYQNADNEKALALACAAEGKPVTVQNVIDAYNRLIGSGQLATTKDAEATFEDFHQKNPWYDTQGNGPILRVKAQPLIAENLEKAARELGELGTNVLAVVPEYADGYREFIQRHPEFAGRGTAGNRLLAFSLLDIYQPPKADAF